MPRKAKGIVEQRSLFLKGCKFIHKAQKKHCEGGFGILGIDPAINSTGYAFRKSQASGVKTGTITSSTYGFSRLIKIETAFRKILDQKRFAPFVVIEGYAMNATWGREAAGELGGVIRRLLYFKKRPLLVVSPLTLKAWVKAKKKEHIMLEILDRFGVKISNSDAADAFILQDIGFRCLLMVHCVIKENLNDPEDVRVFFKGEEYKDTDGLEKLFKYQANSLFKIILNQGSYAEFFLKARPEL